MQHAMRRRWAINGRFLTQPMTGVTRVAREIVSALDELMTSAQGGNGELASDIDIEILCPPGAAPMAGLETIRTRTVGRRTGHLWEQIELPRHVEGGLSELDGVVMHVAIVPP